MYINTFHFSGLKNIKMLGYFLLLSHLCYCISSLTYESQKSFYWCSIFFLLTSWKWKQILMGEGEAMTDKDNFFAVQAGYKSLFELLEELTCSTETTTIKAVGRYDAKEIAEAKARSTRLFRSTLESEMSTSIYRDILASFNFTENLIGTVDYVSMHQNGTPKSEPAKLVTAGVVEIGILQSVLRPEVSIQLAYLHPTNDLGSVTAHFMEPPPSFTNDFYADPFSGDLWHVLFFTWFIILAIILILTKIYKNCDLRLLDYSDMISWTTTFITAQGWDLRIPDNSFRLVCVIARLTYLVLYGVYCGAIISVLSLHISSINNFQDLIKNGFLFESYAPSASMGNYLKELILAEKLTQEEIMINGSEMMKSLKQGDFPPKAFLHYGPSFYQVAQENNILDRVICERISTVDVTKISSRSAMVVRKDYKYRELFNYKIIQLKERGLNQRYQRIYNLNSLPMCPKENRIQEQRNLSLYEVQFAFLVVFIAGVVGTFVLALEITIFSFRMKCFITNS